MANKYKKLRDRLSPEQLARAELQARQMTAEIGTGKRKIIKRIRRPGPRSEEELKRLREIRESVKIEFPPLKPPRRKRHKPG
jgi:hypothetical protein